MHGRHIALFPLPSKGHINPFLGLCPELVRRGHRVSLVTDELHAKLAIPAGAEPVIFETSKLSLTTSETNGLPASDPKRWEEVGRNFLPWHLNNAALAAWGLDRFYKENRPDLIIYEPEAYAARILARRLHSPAIQYYCDFVHPGRYFHWQGGVGHNPPSILEFSRLLDSFLSAYGFEEPNNLWHSEDLNFCAFPFEFQFDANWIDSRRFCFVGPFLDRPFTPVWRNCSGGKRVILVSAVTGATDADYFTKFADALSASEYHVILSVGEHFPICEPLSLGRNVEINRYASHLEILPCTDLHFYSGGAGGTLEGCHFGVPLIALPSVAHNHKVASRLAELGVALNLPLHTLTQQAIRESVQAALQDDAFLGRVEDMRRLIRGSGGSVMAADRIEEFLAGRA